MVLCGVLSPIRGSYDPRIHSRARSWSRLAERSRPRSPSKELRRPPEGDPRARDGALEHLNQVGSEVTQIFLAQGRRTCEIDSPKRAERRVGHPSKGGGGRSRPQGRERDALPPQSRLSCDGHRPARSGAGSPSRSRQCPQLPTSRQRPRGPIPPGDKIRSLGSGHNRSSEGEREDTSKVHARILMGDRPAHNSRSLE